MNSSFIFSAFEIIPKKIVYYIFRETIPKLTINICMYSIYIYVYNKYIYIDVYIYI